MEFFMNEKRYYWLKLKDDFFKDKGIKKLRKIAGGDTYTIIYLKLQLLSLKNNGKLIFDKIEETFHEELSLEIDEDAENIKITLLFLQQVGLLEEINQNEFMLPQAVKSIGSECDSAERVRRLRENKLLLSNDTALHCNIDVTKCNTEIEIDKELELKKENTSLPYPPLSDKDAEEKNLLNNQKDEEEETTDQLPKKDSIPYVQIAELYNEYLGDMIPRLRNPKNLPTTVKRHIKARFKNQLPSAIHWESFYIRICESDFLMGKIADKEGKLPNFCDFYWIIKEMNCEKILSGKYDNKENPYQHNNENQPKRKKPWEIV